MFASIEKGCMFAAAKNGILFWLKVHITLLIIDCKKNNYKKYTKRIVG